MLSKSVNFLKSHSKGLHEVAIATGNLMLIIIELTHARPERTHIGDN